MYCIFNGYNINTFVFLDESDGNARIILMDIPALRSYLAAGNIIKNMPSDTKEKIDIPNILKKDIDSLFYAPSRMNGKAELVGVTGIDILFKFGRTSGVDLKICIRSRHTFKHTVYEVRDNSYTSTSARVKDDILVQLNTITIEDLRDTPISYTGTRVGEEPAVVGIQDYLSTSFGKGSNSTILYYGKGRPTSAEIEALAKETTKSVDVASLFDGEDDEKDDVVDTIIRKYSKYDPDCPYCHGTGTIESDGFVEECSCGAKLAKIDEARAARENASPSIKVPKAVRDNVVQYGLIPKEYKDLEYDSEYIKDNLHLAEYIELVGYEKFSRLLNTILVSCKEGRKLKHSYLIGGDPGLGKKTFVYTCLKYLYTRNVPNLCKYISLSELGKLRNEYNRRYYDNNNSSEVYYSTFEKLVVDTISKECKVVIDNVCNGIIEKIQEEEKRATPSDSTAQRKKKSQDSPDVAAVKSQRLSSDKVLSIIRKNKRDKFNQLVDSLNSMLYDHNESEGNFIHELDDFSARLMNTWDDYLKAPIIFVHFTGPHNREFEAEVLRDLLDIRGKNALPTIAILQDGLMRTTFANECEFDTPQFLDKENLLLLWQHILVNGNSVVPSEVNWREWGDTEEKMICYDRMLYTSCYLYNTKRLRTGKDV